MNQVLACKKCRSLYKYPSGEGCLYSVELKVKTIDWGGCTCEQWNVIVSHDRTKIHWNMFVDINNKLAKLFYL